MNQLTPHFERFNQLWAEATAKLVDIKCPIEIVVDLPDGSQLSWGKLNGKWRICWAESKDQEFKDVSEVPITSRMVAVKGFVNLRNACIEGVQQFKGTLICACDEFEELLNGL